MVLSAFGSANHFSFSSPFFLNLFHLLSAPLFLSPSPRSLPSSLTTTPNLLPVCSFKPIPFSPPPLSFSLWLERWSQVGLQTWVMWLRLTHTSRHQPSVWSQQWHKHKNKHTQTHTHIIYWIDTQADRLGGADNMKPSHASGHYHHLILCDHYWGIENESISDEIRLLTVNMSMTQHTRTHTDYYFKTLRHKKIQSACCQHTAGSFSYFPY